MRGRGVGCPPIGSGVKGAVASLLGRGTRRKEQRVVANRLWWGGGVQCGGLFGGGSNGTHARRHNKSEVGEPQLKPVLGGAAKTVKRPRQQPAHPPIRQLLGAADAQTAHHAPHSPNTPTTGLRERGNDTSKSTGRSGRHKAATRRNTRREERVTVQGPVKTQQPDGMSHRGRGGGQQRIWEGVPDLYKADQLRTAHHYYR